MTEFGPRGKRENIRPGGWWCMCCLHDLYEIADEDEAEEVRGYWDENLLNGAWATKAEALEALIPEHSGVEVADWLARQR